MTVHLHGPLAEQYGTSHSLAVLTPREAVAALDANYPGFLADFVRHDRYGILADGDVREGDTAAVLPVAREMHFYPLIEGNVPLIVPFVAAAFGIGTMAATIVSGLLVTALLVGVSLLFRPKMPEVEREEEKRDESYVFSGPENVTGQGVAVPLIYGRVYAGSVVVSAGQDVSQLTATGAVAGSSVPSGGTFLLRQGASPLLDPPPEGWPAIIEDPVYHFKPEGWVPAAFTWVADEEDIHRKQVMVWQPDYDVADSDQIYNWNMVRGFYETAVGLEAEEEEWIAGEEMETPIEDPVD